MNMKYLYGHVSRGLNERNVSRKPLVPLAEFMSN